MRGNEVKEILKKFVYRYTKFGKPVFPYNLEPQQLSEIIKSIVDLSRTKDNLVLFEIGVARGMTTRFIAEHISLNNLDVEYYCIDTFSSFTTHDLNYETSHRGKSLSELSGFSYNDFSTWKRNLSEFAFINAIQCDVSTFDFNSVENKIDFVLLDVDLYLPTINALRSMKDYLSNGAIILVDDVANNNRWDGAYEAFFEFIEEEKLNFEIIGNKCGKIIWNK